MDLVQTRKGVVSSIARCLGLDAVVNRTRILHPQKGSSEGGLFVQDGFGQDKKDVWETALLEFE